jgi:hypothetical protein
MNCTMSVDSGFGVLRTGWVETATVTDPRAQKELIQPDKDYERCAHQQVSRKSLSSS